MNCVYVLLQVVLPFKTLFAFVALVRHVTMLRSEVRLKLEEDWKLLSQVGQTYLFVSELFIFLR